MTNLIMRPHTGAFEFTGRPMKGWLAVEPAGLESDDDLQDWVSIGSSFARSLPSK